MISPVLFTVRLTPHSAKSLRAIARTYHCTIEHFLRQAAVYYVKAVGYGEVIPQPTQLKKWEPRAKLPEPKKKKKAKRVTAAERMRGAGCRARERNLRLGMMDVQGRAIHQLEPPGG